MPRPGDATSARFSHTMGKQEPEIVNLRRQVSLFQSQSGSQPPHLLLVIVQRAPVLLALSSATPSSRCFEIVIADAVVQST